MPGRRPHSSRHTPCAVADSSRHAPGAGAGYLLAACWLLFAGGCAGYQVGARSMYPADIQTVYVPMFESNSFRRNLGERLTEAVMKEIQLKTPYQVVSTPNADSVLSGRIVGERKQVMIETGTDEAREIQVHFLVEVTWIDRQGGVIHDTEAIPLPAPLVVVEQTASLIPEVGQSVATAQQEAIQRVAEQIVSLMEAPW
ncbi:MAG: LptE family protein [Pirellulales bacterium]